MIDWPENLVKDFARRRAVLVIGSGISQHSSGIDGARPPTWKSFLEKAVMDCPVKSDLQSIKDALSANDLLHACEWLKKRYDENWLTYLRKIFLLSKFTPANIHYELYKLDCRIVLSMNFDDIYERYANQVSHGTHLVKNFYDADVSEFLRGDGRYIIKVHGNLNAQNKMIFSQKDYSEARSKFGSFYQAFDAALLTHTFVFIGSGYNDPDINLLLENQNFGFPSQSPHYFVCPIGMHGDRRASLRENRNLKILEYEPIDAIHSGLVIDLKSLNEKVETEMHIISEMASW